MTANVSASSKSPPARALKAAAKEMSKAIRKQASKKPSEKQVKAVADKYITEPSADHVLAGAAAMKSTAHNIAQGQQEAFTPSETGQLATQSVAADQLRTIVERIERLEEEKKSLGADIKDVYGEAKANGFDGKALRKIIALRRMDRDQRMEEEAMLELYKQALGMA